MDEPARRFPIAQSGYPFSAGHAEMGTGSLVHALLSVSEQAFHIIVCPILQAAHLPERSPWMKKPESLTVSSQILPYRLFRKFPSDPIIFPPFKDILRRGIVCLRQFLFVPVPIISVKDR